MKTFKITIEKFQSLIYSIIILSACNNNFEDYSTQPSDRLSFSIDTVAFDTILSTINTPYKVLMIYNRHSKPLLISAVSLENGKNGFKINVDGKAGTDFHDVEIRANDSLYVFVSAKPMENASAEPQYLTDRVIFVTNGVRQEIVLSASSQDVILWKGGYFITEDTVLSNQRPYLIYDSLVVEAGKTLQIEEGATFYMHNNAKMIIKGRVTAKGTLEKPILIRGDRFDSYADIPYDHVPGQWEGIRFESDSYDNELEYVTIRNGQYGFDFQPSDPSRSKMKLNNVILTNFKGVLFNAVNCNIEAGNCEFSNARYALLRLIGGRYRFLHCTIANYYMSNQEAGWGNSNNETVQILATYDQLDGSEPVIYPLEQADFYNSIIWGQGSASDIRIEEDENVHAYFQNCIIPNKDATNDDPNDPNIEAQLVNCLIHIDPKFQITNSDNLFYDFRLDSISPAKNVANVLISQEIPYDMKGNNRFLDQGPDLGAYEYKAILAKNDN